MLNIEFGQGFKYIDRSGETRYGLVVGIGEHVVEWLPVVAAHSRINVFVAYDEPDAVYERDKNHVRLRSCPPPFTTIGSFKNYKGDEISESIVIADMSHVYNLSVDKFRSRCVIIDDGVKVSNRDMDIVFHHPWESRRQKEFLRSDKWEFSFDDISSDSMDKIDMELN